MTIAQLQAAIPVVDGDGRLTQRFRTYLNELEKLVPYRGTGSPEGVVTAPLYALYLDESGGAGSIQYRKMSEEIAGDRSMGWLAV
jgi:hypothetical protein